MNKIKSISYGATDNFFTTEPRSKAQGYGVDSIEEFTHHQTGCTEDEYNNVIGRSYCTAYYMYKNGNLVATIINPVNCTVRYWEETAPDLVGGNNEK